LGKLLLAFVRSFLVLGSMGLMTKFFSLMTLGVLQRLIAAAWLVGQLGNLLLALTSTVILGSVSRGTHDHILLPHDSGSCEKFPFFSLCLVDGVNCCWPIASIVISGFWSHRTHDHIFLSQDSGSHANYYSRL
jgi:hypothetical protein